MDATSNYQPFAVRGQFNNVASLTNPSSRLPGGDPFPYSYNPKNPQFIYPAGIWGNLAGLQVALQLPIELLGTAAFAVPAPGAEGNFPRNVLVGPGVKDVDMGLFRTFRLVERMQLQVRAEGTNMFNLVTFSNPTATLNSSIFGQIRTAAAMRAVQMGLRLVF